MDPNGGALKPSLVSGLSLLERARELQWTLQLGTAMLFADLVLTWCTGRSIAHLSIQANHLLANVGVLLVSGLGFSVLMSIVLPLAAMLVQQLFDAVPWPHWMQNDRDYRRPAGAVLASELRAYAYKKNDGALVGILVAHERREQKSTAETLAAGQLAFSFLVLGFFNYFSGILGIPALTLLNEMSVTFGRVGELAIGGALFAALLTIKFMWFSDSPMRWIDYPPLYDELENARKQQRLMSN